ncbi:MAG: VOC family protein [Spirochaetales bacterium]|nr:VOC family protein [Spirochaetales bacterium]
MKLEFVTVRTKDLEASIRFYESLLGFTVVRRFSPRPGMELAFLSDGSGGQVEFIQSDEPVYEGRGISLGFRVADAEAWAETLRGKGVTITHGPVAMPNGVKLLGAKDPNGLDLGFVQEAQVRT